MNFWRRKIVWRVYIEKHLHFLQNLPFVHGAAALAPAASGAAAGARAAAPSTNRFAAKELPAERKVCYTNTQERRTESIVGEKAVHHSRENQYCTCLFVHRRKLS